MKLKPAIKSFDYKVKRSGKKGVWMVLCNNNTYRIFKGAFSGTWYIRRNSEEESVNQTATLRDAIFCVLEEEGIL